MNKAILKYWVDVGLLISFLIVGISGIFKMPEFRSWFLWVFEIIPGRTMRLFHDWAGIALVILVAIHLILNWSWIVAMTKNIFRIN